MCGIAGIFSYSSKSHPVDTEELLRIRERMISRGPDGAGLWFSPDRKVGLAHRRLAIIDLSEAASQPMTDSHNGNCIVFNGEIYNYPQLRKELVAAGCEFQSHSDTEVLLKLYGMQGQSMVHKLRGMYAFAIWDATKKGVFLARDPFGIKPLYIADDGSSLRFASQVKALIAGGKINTSPDSAGHVGFYLWGHVPEPFTLYRGIRALSPGASLWLELGGHRQETTFFSFSHELYQSQPVLKSIKAEEAHEQLRVALLDSLRHHFVSDVPVGLFLSSGLDSATLVALASELGGRSPYTVTLGFHEFARMEQNEVPLAEMLAAHYGTRQVTNWVSKRDFQDHYRNLIAAMDQPSIDGVNSYFVCLVAKKAGLKVAISGLGGDELFSGYNSFTTIPRMVKSVKPFSYVPGLGRGLRKVLSSSLSHFASPKAAGLVEYGGDYAGAYLLRRGLFMPWELPDVMDSDMASEGLARLNTLASLRHTVSGIVDPQLKISALESSWYMRNQLLRDTDWASMAHSLEVRVPFVDIDVFKAVVRLVKSGHAPTKQDMATTPSARLPEAVLNRRKTGFSVPVREWLLTSTTRKMSKKYSGLRPWACQIMSSYT